MNSKGQSTQGSNNASGSRFNFDHRGTNVPTQPKVPQMPQKPATPQPKPAKK